MSVEAARSRVGLTHFAAPTPGRRIGLVYRASSGRDEAYRQLAAIMGESISNEQQVRLVN